MKPAPIPIRPHRVQRLTRWLRLWLQWFAPALPVMLAAYPALLRRVLRRASRGVAEIVLLHAVLRVHPSRRVAPKGWTRPRAYMRAMLGSHLRKASRRREPAARFFALLTVMRELERHVRRFAKRLARQLARSVPISPAREHGVVAFALATPPLASATDTS